MSSSTPQDDRQQGHGEQTPVSSKPRMKKQTRRRVHTSRPYQERLLNMAEARREIVTALRIHRANMRQQSKYQLEQREQQPRMKKQTRRRVHTSRPYQERLLNMAEARREIVTALRIHRANMRQQSKYQLEQREQQPRLQQPAQVILQEQSQAFQRVSPVATTSYAYASSSSNNHLCSSPLANLISGAPAGNYNSSSYMLSYHLAPLEKEAPAAGATGDLEQQLACCSLPAQPLGLNLSFRDFGRSLDNGKNRDDAFGVPLIQSSSCPAASPYSSPAVTAIAGHGYSSSADAPAELSQVLGIDGDMLYSIGGGGERLGVELSEAAANVPAASAWWTKILESMEGGVGESAGAAPQSTGAEADGMAQDVVVAAAAGWPEWQWLCDGGGVGAEQEVAAGSSKSKPDILEAVHVDDGDYGGCYEGGHQDNDGGHDISFPRMDILGDIEGWDDDGDEWFS